MNELYDDLAAKLDSLHVHRILEAKEWRSTNFVYIFIIEIVLNEWMSCTMTSMLSWIAYMCREILRLENEGPLVSFIYL
jgi:hypothetical protein